MAVFEVVTWDVKSGRMDEFLALARDLKGICERVDVGLASIRVAEATIAGPNSGRVAMIFEHSDLASWGASVEHETQDAAYKALAARASGPDQCATLVSRAVMTEVQF